MNIKRYTVAIKMIKPFKARPVRVKRVLPYTAPKNPAL